MKGEMERIATVWISVTVSLSYCYTIGRLLPKGIPRFLLFLPIVFLFLLLPLQITSPNLTGMMGFFIAFLGNFKLLLFAFGKGPLLAAEASLPRFIAVGCLPIKVVRQVGEGESENKKCLSLWNYGVKAVLLATLVKAYDYGDQIHPKVMLLLYCLHLYFSLEIAFSVLGAIARAAFGLELEPQFNQPHLSTSLQDFWGHRWNLIVPAILRPAVHEPIRNLSSRLIGPRWSLLPAVLATFLVSGLMHEVMFYYSALGQVRPTWQMTKFFLVHGLCLVAEVALKKVVAGRWRLPGLVSGALAVTFVASTGIGWFMPMYVEIGLDKRAMEEIRDVGRAILQLFPFLSRD